MIGSSCADERWLIFLGTKKNAVASFKFREFE
jgi:hypothetical protein